MTDAKILEMLGQGSREAFDAVYDRYWEKLFLYVAKVIRDKDEAQDIVQEIFVSLWLRREKLGTINSLPAYLFAAARYKGISYIQANVNKNNFSESLSSFMAAQNYSPDQQQSADELESLINRGVTTLPAKMKMVYALSRNEGLSHKQISEKLGISDKTVKKQISNALKHLRLKIANRNLALICSLLQAFSDLL